MSSSSENGSDTGTPTPGNASFRSQSSGSNSPTPSPSSRSSSIKQSTNVNLNSDENNFKLSKCTSPNGYHTPEEPEDAATPPNEGESLDNPAEPDDLQKLNKSNGRLKFFKDGMLCLELSHHDEGQKTKWVQVRGKSMIPQIVQVTKEAKIPCQLTQQTLFSTPNSNHVQSSSRVESSTSHSMSDDGSSILSSASPRLRDSTWRKQPVPQRCLSFNSDFYMKPASCVVSLNFRHEVQAKARLCTLRRPYSMPDFVNIFREKVVPGVSKCGLNASSGNLCMCDSFSVVANSKLINGENYKLRAETNKKVSMQLIEKRLSDLVEIRLKFKREKETQLHGCLKNNTGGNTSAPRTLVKPSSTKLTKAEMRDRDLMSGFRPIISKKSQQRNVEKTILSVPGHGTIFKKRQNDIDLKHNLSLTQHLNYSKSSRPQTISGGDTTDGKTVDLSISDKHRNRTSRDTTRQRNDRKSKTTNSNIAKSSSSSSSILKPNPRPTEQVTDYSNSYRLQPFTEPNLKSAMPYSPPPSSSINTSQPDHKYLQKQTVSKVISYTINSLLGTDSSNGTSPISSKSLKHRFANSTGLESPPLADLSLSSSRRPSSEVENNSKEGVKAKTNVHPFSMGDEDQSSFLRHLLDTSDPIPSPQVTTSTASPSSKIHPTPPKKRSAINNHSSSNNTSPSKSRRSPKSQSVNCESTSILIAKPVSSTNSVQPYFSGPKHHTTPEKASGGMIPSTYHHYSSLLPPTFIPSLNTSNPYFDPPESRTSSHPMPHLNYTGDTALNLSHRGGWPPPFFLPPPTFPSFHERASSSGCQDLSMNRRNISPFPDGHRGSTSSDNDLPLNLCKKPRPN